MNDIIGRFGCITNALYIKKFSLILQLPFFLHFISINNNKLIFFFHFHSKFSDEECVNRVKQLYEDLGLPHTYSLYEEESYNLIKTHIQQTSRGVPHKIFFKIMDKIYRRES